MKKQIRLIILTGSLVIALSAGLAWAISPIYQAPADFPVIAAKGNGSGNGGNGPMGGTGNGPGDCSLNPMMNYPTNALQAGHGKKHGHGPGDSSGKGRKGQGDGSGNGGKGPRDGSGHGPGDCTGPINS